MPDRHERDHLRWQCRRGMLELDYLLEAFLDRHFDQLNSEQQAQFVRLLDVPDPVLQAWFMGEEKPGDVGFVALVEDIRAVRF